MIETISSIVEWQALRGQITKTLGFVPTMGNLHAGHKSLLERSVKENELTVLSIYVNPTQFDDQADYANYPKTLEQDLNLAEQLGVNYILTPSYDELYVDNYRYHIIETELSKTMEGKSRVGHFDGVLTVVMKLLMLVKASKVYLGEKDFQQLQLVKGMAEVFFVDTEIVACPIVRDVNGLALSSRNSRLSPEQYKMALNFPRILSQNLPIQTIKQQLNDCGLEVDYVEEYQGRRLGAVKVGDVRLIDNFYSC